MEFTFSYFTSTSTAKEETKKEGATGFTYENLISYAVPSPWISEETLWVLGKRFKLPEEREDFLEFVRSKLWFTYRKGFNPIGSSGLTSDSGWGCTLRCGQMMLAQALSILTLSKDWKWHAAIEQTLAYKQILMQLSDVETSCYSIHRIAEMGVLQGKEIGEWFGPNTIAQVLRKISLLDGKNTFTFHVALDHTLCIEDVEAVCCLSRNDSNACNVSRDAFCASRTSAKETPAQVASVKSSVASTCTALDERIDTFWKPLFLILPLRLGISEINPLYFKHLKDVLQWKESVGIIGGRPKHACYFLGCSDDDSLLYLDPHTTQSCVTFPELDSEENFDDSSYHCDCPSKMPLSQLDPSLALGFVCTTKEQFEELCDRVKSFEKSATSLPLFEVLQSNPFLDVREYRMVSSKSGGQRNHDDHCDSKQSDMYSVWDSDAGMESEEEFEILEFG